MRLFEPVIIVDNKGIVYAGMTAENAIKFGEKHKEKNVIFKTKMNGIEEHLTLKQLTSVS